MLSAFALLSGCSSIDKAPTSQALMACDMQGIGQLALDTQTRIIAVQNFKAGDEVRLANSPTPHVKTTVDVCMVKMVVGPGNPGPAGAPSTSPGIGIEVWLPARDQWNQTIRAYGSGGWAGGFYADPTRIGQSGGGNAIFLGAVQKGYAVSGSDHGHGGSVSGRNASFAMNPDGSVNTVLWQDFAERSLLEQALKTKAVVKAYYSKAQAKAYFDGFSTGGRQGYKLAQKFHAQYDGILAGAPAFNWTRFITSELYPQVVMQRDLGRTIPNAKLNAASALALRSCGGAQANWGFLLDPLACAYNPARDPAALCAGEAGEAGVQGTNAQSTCLGLKEAQTLNKIWFGMTRDGSAPDPAQDNGRTGTAAAQRGQLWWGLTRGTDLTALAGEKEPFPISSQVVALSLQNPRIAQKGMFNNATGNAEDGWKALSYSDLVSAYERGLAMQVPFSNINTDSTDLSGLRDRGAKVLSYHGLSDQLIMPQGSLNYFERLVQEMGGVDKVQAFNRLFFIPGLGHTGAFNGTASIGLDGATTPTSAVPLPQPATGRDELFNALRNWVEKGVAPDRIELTSAAGNLSLPICSHPKKAVLTGASPNAASSYTCR
ncbi:MAG TPA: tannase/feruloyl esterase family alpha/beta hydrolase [Hydrogenophaga sp.]|nr:MAG: feruloyl esterase [Burkholderiales bacterium GWE1_65_30]OGA91165.1 MAG: feruloyl esterase [Burkholderiales bacterium GWF1_66_17]HAX23399.1 tannase/feruloyl esterase family alpha/beta hydrolase [Hydrogenophaga sp.]